MPNHERQYRSTTVEYIKSPLGQVRLELEGDRLRRLSFETPPPSAQNLKSSSVALELEQQLVEYFDAKRVTLDLKVQLGGTEFQRRVWQHVMEIPYGESMSYQALASAMGDPGAVRAVARANAANPLLIFVPCHRVIGSDGELRGYAGGLWRKEALLDLERGVTRLFD